MAERHNHDVRVARVTVMHICMLKHSCPKVNTSQKTKCSLPILITVVTSTVGALVPVDGGPTGEQVGRVAEDMLKIER